MRYKGDGSAPGPFDYFLASSALCAAYFVKLYCQTRSSRLAAWQALHGGNSDDLELWIMQRLEWLRITSRSAPMLGLVATMIPMGPALLALTRNDAQGIGENLVVAFSAVILALVAASITFFILTVRRRWLLQELRAVERAREAG
ncbi:MotA/TolQ/ExbB proton channel family protein [Pseudomonas aeruginosa]|uniref:MotA/TolQ/ExbB proton channel family protein n=1 Tax=Pseudomonas aeruginosa TaxID=287 RepID=UPI0035BEA22F